MELEKLISMTPEQVKSSLAAIHTTDDPVIATLDRKKLFTIDEAVALYLAATGVCIDGTLKYVKHLNLPSEQRLSLFDIARYSENQWGHAAFVRNVLSGASVRLTNESIQMGKSKNNNYSKKDLDGRLTIEQQDGEGQLTDSKVGDLDVDVITNSSLKLESVKITRDFYIRSHSSNKIEINNVEAENNVRMIIDSANKMSGQVSAGYNCNIDISSCVDFEFGITAKHFDINISTANSFLLRQNNFESISYIQSSSKYSKIRIPIGYKVCLTGDRKYVDCPSDLIDEASSHKINLRISSGRLIIEAIH